MVLVLPKLGSLIVQVRTWMTFFIFYYKSILNNFIVFFYLVYFSHCLVFGIDGFFDFAEKFDNSQLLFFLFGLRFDCAGFDFFFFFFVFLNFLLFFLSRKSNIFIFVWSFENLAFIFNFLSCLSKIKMKKPEFRIDCFWKFDFPSEIIYDFFFIDIRDHHYF